MPVSQPPQLALNEFLGATTRHTRRVEIYEADGVTRWAKDKALRLKDGSVSVDYGRDERRTLDLTLSNDDGVLINAPGEFWYDKIIKVFRGVRVNQDPDSAQPKILIIADKSGEDAMAQTFRNHLAASGYGYVRINPVATDYNRDVAPFDIIVGLGAATTPQMALLAQAYSNGKSVFVQDMDASSFITTKFSGTNTSANSNGGQLVPIAGSLHPVSKGWPTFTPLVGTRVYTNLVSNPGAESTSGPYTVRTNLATDPLATASTPAGTGLGFSTSRWFGSGGAGTHTYVTAAVDGPTPNITTYLRKAWTTAPAGNGDTGIACTLAGGSAYGGFAANTTYSFSCWLRSSSDKSSVGIDIAYYDASSSLIGSMRQNGFSLKAGQWTKITGAFTTPPNGMSKTQIAADVDGGMTWVVGDTLDATGLLVEAIGYAGPVLRTSLCLYPNAELGATTGWTASGAATISTTTAQFHTGTKSYMVVCPGSAINEGISQSPTTCVVSSGTANVETLSVYVLAPAGATLLFAAEEYTTGNVFVATRGSVNFTGTGAWQRVTATGTKSVAANVLRSYVRTATTAQAITFYVDSALNEAVGTLGSYFDGTTSTANSEAAYTGTLHASTSINRDVSVGYYNHFFAGSYRPRARYNRFTNPAAITGQTRAEFVSRWGWAPTFATGLTNGPNGLTTYYRLTAPASPSAQPGGVDHFINMDTTTYSTYCVLEPNTTYTFSSWVRANRARTAKASWRVHNGTAWNGSKVDGPTVIVPANTWTQVYVTFTTPASGTPWYGSFRSSLVESNPVAGDTIDVTSVMLERTDTVQPYFDGAHPVIGGVDIYRAAAWAGTANQSQSYAYDSDIVAPQWGPTGGGTANNSASYINTGIPVNSYAAASGTSLRNYQSSVWKASGSYAMRQTPYDMQNTNSYTTVNGNSTAVSNTNTLRPAHSYTIIATCRTEAVQTGTLDPNARSLVVAYNTIAGNVGETIVNLGQLNNTPGSAEFRGYVTIPASVVWAQVRLYNGALVGGGDTWWDQVAIIEDNYVGRYFDGNFTSTADKTYAWVGSANNSNSTVTYNAWKSYGETTAQTKIVYDNQSNSYATVSAFTDPTSGGRAVTFNFPVIYQQYDVPEFMNLMQSTFGWLDTVEPLIIWETQIGEFMIDRISEPHFPHEMKITGRDYTKKCLLSKYTQATQFLPGLNLEDIIAGIAGAAGIVKRSLPVTGVVVGSTFYFDRGTDRWSAMKQIADAYNYEIYFDATGYLTMRPYRDPASSAPTIWIQTGKQGQVASYEKSTSDSRMYNSVVVTGESSDSSIPPVWAVAKNTDPNSPTSIPNIGERLYQYSSSFITTTTQAQAVADSFLAVHSLEQFELNFDTLMLPWLEVGDILGWIDPDPAPGDPTSFLLDTLTLPLGLAPMSGTANRVTIVS